MNLDHFFSHIEEHCKWFHMVTGKQPSSLFISFNLMGKLASTEGFYSRPEVRSAEVTAHAPVVRRFKIGEYVLTIYDRPDVDFLYIE